MFHFYFFKQSSLTLLQIIKWCNVLPFNMVKKSNLSSSQWYLINIFTAFIDFRVIFQKCPRKSVKTCALENFPLATPRVNNGKHAFTNLTIQVSFANSEHSSILQIVIICAVTGDLVNICSGRETQQIQNHSFILVWPTCRTPAVGGLIVCEWVCVCPKTCRHKNYCSAHDEWLIMKLCTYVMYHDANNMWNFGCDPVTQLNLKNV